MKPTKAIRNKLGTLVDAADQTVAEGIRARGVNAANVREVGPWARVSRGETAWAAIEGDNGGQGDQDRQASPVVGTEIRRGYLMNLPVHAPKNADPLLLPPRETPYVLKDVLEKVVYRCRDELILSLGDCFLRFKVDSDTDTITSQFEPSTFRGRKGYASLQSAKPWKKFIGKECGWTWFAWNQQGYVDSVLISFDGIEPSVLLNTIGSSIELFMISPVDKAPVARANRNGKRNTRAKP